MIWRNRRQQRAAGFDSDTWHQRITAPATRACLTKLERNPVATPVWWC